MASGSDLAHPLRGGLARLFNSEPLSDCTIRFYLDQQHCSAGTSRSEEGPAVSGELESVDWRAALDDELSSSDDGSSFSIDTDQESSDGSEMAVEEERGEQVDSGDAGAAGSSSPAPPPAAQQQVVYLGGPLHVHRGITSLCCEFVKRKLEGWSGTAAGGAGGGRCEVLVPLGNEAEVPHATEALRYIYTGELTAGLGSEALLRVRQQAGYLGVAGCAEACDNALVAWVEGNSNSGGEAAATAGGGSRSCAVDFYANHELFPHPETSEQPASFARVLAALAPLLVAHFKDAVRVLSSAELQAQLLQLPACAVEALLASDAFTTDSESSVVLLVARWVEANWEVATRKEVRRVWRHVRLSRVSRPYLGCVLPCLKGMLGLIGRSPLTAKQMGLLHLFASASEKVRADGRKELSAAASMPPAWLSAPSRTLGVHAEARLVEWSISRERLLAALRAAKGLQPSSSGGGSGGSSGGGSGGGSGGVGEDEDDDDMTQDVYAVFEEGQAAPQDDHNGGWTAGDRDVLLSQGLLWSVKVCLDPEDLWHEAAAPAAPAAPTAAAAAGGSGAAAIGDDRTPAAGLYVSCRIPRPLVSYVQDGLVSSGCLVSVNTWEGGARFQEYTVLGRDKYVMSFDGSGWGFNNFFELQQQPAPEAGAGGRQALAPQVGGAAAPAAASEDAALLAPWRDYLGPDGGITGSIEFKHDERD